MNDFTATHVIQTGTRRTYVHAEQAERADGGGLILYTEQEWGGCSNADWTYDEEDGLKFQGSTSAPICHGATIQTFAACPWTRSDGWNDNGTRAA